MTLCYIPHLPFIIEFDPLIFEFDPIDKMVKPFLILKFSPVIFDHKELPKRRNLPEEGLVSSSNSLPGGS